MPVTVAIDAMGGDHGPAVTLLAALRFLETERDARIIAVGLEAPMRAVLAKHKSPALARLSLHAASEVVAMDEAPALALRAKKDSSMRVAVNLVKEGAAQACLARWRLGRVAATDPEAMARRAPGHPDAAGQFNVAQAAAPLGVAEDLRDGERPPAGFLPCFWISNSFASTRNLYQNA